MRANKKMDAVLDILNKQYAKSFEMMTFHKDFLDPDDKDMYLPGSNREKVLTYKEISAKLLKKHGAKFYDLYEVLAYLLKENQLHKTEDFGEYWITWKGKMFIESGGYSRKRKVENWKFLVGGAVILITILTAITTIAYQKLDYDLHKTEAAAATIQIIEHKQSKPHQLTLQQKNRK